MINYCSGHECEMLFFLQLPKRFVIRMARSLARPTKERQPNAPAIISFFSWKEKKVFEWIFIEGRILIIDDTTVSFRKEYIHKYVSIFFFVMREWGRGQWLKNEILVYTENVTHLKLFVFLPITFECIL